MNIAKKAAVLIISAFCAVSLASCEDGKIGSDSSEYASMNSLPGAGGTSSMNGGTDSGRGSGVMSDIGDIMSSAEEFFSSMMSGMMSNGYVGSDANSQ